MKSRISTAGVRKLVAQSVTIIAILILSSSFAGAQLKTVDSLTTSSSITLSWTAPGDDGYQGTATSYDIRYSLSTITEANWGSANQVNNEPTPLPAGTAQSYTVNNLNSGTTYYFAIKSADEAGNISPLSNVVVHTTAPESDNLPPANISDLAASNPTQNSVSLSWTAPGDDGNSGTAAQYDIRYATYQINDANWNSATQVSNEPSPGPAGSQETFTVTGLQPGTTYYFVIKTADEIPNWSGLSNLASATTQNGNIAPAAITDLAVVTANQNEVTLTWTAPGADGNQGQASSYDLRYSTSPISEANWNNADRALNEPRPAPAGSTETYAVTGLLEETLYYFAIKTADEVPNYSPLSNVASATTPDQTPPGTITDLSGAR